MACELFQGATIGCKDFTGGVEEIYLANYDNVSTPLTNTSGQVSSITMASSKFYVFQVVKETAQYDNNGTSDPVNGTSFWESTTVFNIYGMSASQKNTLKELLKARLMGIVKDSQGVYHIVGETRGVDALTITNTTGKAMGDLNGATVTLSGKEPDPDPVFTGDITTVTS